MLSDDTPVYTPQLYRSLGTPVTLNLGTTATDVTLTRQRVEALPEAVTAATEPIAEDVRDLQAQLHTETNRAIAAMNPDGLKQAVNSHVTDQAQRVINTQTTANAATLDAVKASLTAEVKKVLDKLDALPGPAPASDPAQVVVSARSQPLLSLLMQVQTLTLDATPGQPYKGKAPEFKGWIGENVAIHGLREAARREAVVLAHAPPPLQSRFIKAFDEFTAPDLASRGRRFAEVHALIADLAAFLA